MASDIVLKFLDEHQRPYSVTDIQNGVKDLGKAAVQKALDDLKEKGLLKEKAYGKQRVYFLSPTSKTSAKDLNEDLLVVDRQINELTSKIQENRDIIKATESKFKEIQGKMSLPEACDKKLQLQHELQELKLALKEFDGVDLVSPEVKTTVQENYDKYLGLYKKRKRICLDMLDAILENYPKTKQHLYEDIGIETDEDVGFRI